MLPQELREMEMAKSEAFAPVTPKLAIFNVALPVLLKETETRELVVESDWLPKLRLLLDRLATGAVPVPLPLRAIV